MRLDNGRIINVCGWIRRVTISKEQPRYHGEYKQGRTTASRVCLSINTTKLMPPSMKDGKKSEHGREFPVFSVERCTV